MVPAALSHTLLSRASGHHFFRLFRLTTHHTRTTNHERPHFHTSTPHTPPAHLTPHTPHPTPGNSTLVDRFVRGHYSGLPRREVEEVPEGQGSVLWVAVTVVARAAAAAGVAFVVMFLASKRYA